MRRFFLVLLLFFASVLLFGQSNSYAFVIYAEGYDMSIFRNGELTTYDVIADDVIGMPLLPGDLVQTDADTFVEIQVMPARTVLKVAENTTFEIDSIGGAGGGVFQMSYGRLRARVERITTNDPFEIRGQGAIAGVRGTDFGYDLVVNRESASNQVETKVYCFEGQVEVSENVQSEETAAEQVEQAPRPTPVLISANEMVSVVTELPPETVEEGDEDLEVPAITPAPAPKVISFQTQSIEEEIQKFWTTENFKEEAVNPDLVEERFPGIGEQVRVLSEESRQYEEMQRMRREGLLGTDDVFVAADVVPDEPVIEEVTREPEEVTMVDPLPEDRVRRIITSEDATSPRVRARTAGNWLTGLGLVLGGAGTAYTYLVDGIQSVDAIEEVPAGSPGTAMAMSGTILITSGLISYLVSLFLPAQ